MAVDSSHIYWISFRSARINEADLDGSNPQTLITGQNDPYGVVLLLTGMKIAITLLGGEPVRSDPGIEADYHLCGEPVFPVTIDLLASAAWMHADSPATYQAIYQTDQPPTGSTRAQASQLRAGARANLDVVTRHMREWRATRGESPSLGTDRPRAVGRGAKA